MGRYQAVVFDCDGTLLDSEGLAVGCERLLLARHGYAVTDADIAACVGTTQQATYEYYLARVPSLPPLAEFWEAFDALFYEQAPGRLRAFPDAVEALGLLTARRVRMAVASSTPAERLRWQLGVGGLDDTFQAVIGGDEVREGKPAPDAYLAAAERLGVRPEACLAVEDTRWGAESARAAGMRVIGVERDGGAPLPAHVRTASLMSEAAVAEWGRVGA